MRVKIAFAFCSRQSIWSMPEFLCALIVVMMMSRSWKTSWSVLFNILSRYDSHLAGILQSLLFLRFEHHELCTYLHTCCSVVSIVLRTYSSSNIVRAFEEENNNQITKAYSRRGVDNLADVGGSHRWRLLLLPRWPVTRGWQLLKSSCLASHLIEY